MGPNVIQYNTDELRVQWVAIVKSQMDAWKKITGEHYRKVTRLDENDPEELWDFAVGNSQLPLRLNENELFAEHFRQVDPQLSGDPETYHLFRNSLGAPTMRETILALTNRSKSDIELAGWLEKLLAIYKHGPISRAELGDKSVSTTAQLLLSCWIRPPFGNIQGSLAFFSDRALAKITYFLRNNGDLLPPRLYTTEPERVRKVYRALNLRPADRRAIKDAEYRAGKFHFSLNKTLTPKGR